jgi:hypothetical protein
MVWIAVVVCVILVIYVMSYYRYPSKASILQTSLNQFVFDILLEKQPVVVDDKTGLDVQHMRKSIFNLNPSSEFTIAPSDTWHTNRFKYNIIQLLTSDIQSTQTPQTPESEPEMNHLHSEIYVCHPNTPMGADKCPSQDAKVIAIQMTPGQVVILPFHWYYMLPPEKTSHVSLNCVGVHDLVTYMLP